MSIHGYAAVKAREPLQQFSYDPEDLGPFDVEIAITHCGVCHSDIHLVDNDFQISHYPFIPGHEVVGTVRAMGSQVTNLRAGQRVGVGWQCGSCLECEWCVQGEETCCAQQRWTCVGRHGGFAEAIRVDSRFAFAIPDALDSADAAPLLCAGITVYSPLRAPGIGPDSKVGVIGIGGLGHLALQFARAMGYEVTAFSTTPDKQKEAESFGADRFVVSTDAAQMEQAAGSLDLLICTVNVDLDWMQWMNLLRPWGTLCFVGLPPKPVNISAMSLIMGNRSVRGSGIGNRSTMREMLEFAARHGIKPHIQIMPMSQATEAINIVRNNKARYRIVLEN
jgi:uncharacterized zinc-type alcohol dehydrogenase-like protein